MKKTVFDLYKIVYRGKNYRVLLPVETRQFWAINKKDGGCFWQEMNFYGNRQGIEALEHGCAALAGDDPVIVYIPCRKNRDIRQRGRRSMALILGLRYFFGRNRRENRRSRQ